MGRCSICENILTQAGTCSHCTPDNITPIHSHETDMQTMERMLKRNEVEILIKLQAALDAAVVWFNATEAGFAAEVRPDIAKAQFYRKAKDAGLLD